MIQISLIVPLSSKLLEKWKKAELPIFREDGDKCAGAMIALRSTAAADIFLEKLIHRYIFDGKFRERIDAYIRTNEDVELPRFIAVTVQQGTKIDNYTYSWRREILSKICPIENHGNLDVITCSDETTKHLTDMMAPFD